jgi:hypothetical protein
MARKFGADDGIETAETQLEDEKTGERVTVRAGYQDGDLVLLTVSADTEGSKLTSKTIADAVTTATRRLKPPAGADEEGAPNA